MLLDDLLSSSTSSKSEEEEEEEEDDQSSRWYYEFQGPFEWLTNFNTLASMLDPQYLFPPRIHHQPHVSSSSTLYDSHKSSNLYVLHIGAGTSTVGEDLLETYPTYYSLAINVDKDRSALMGMKQRYQKLKNVQVSLSDTASPYMTTAAPGVSWHYFDFRTPLKTIQYYNPSTNISYMFHSPLQQILYNTIYTELAKEDNKKPMNHSYTDSIESFSTESVKQCHTMIHADDSALSTLTSLDTSPRMDKDFHSNVYYDLIVDKGTLDCALTQESEEEGEEEVYHDSVTHLLCHVHAALRPPPSKPCDQSSATGHYCNYQGGVYVCISLHPKDFLLPLLQNLPKVDWYVEYHSLDDGINESHNNKNYNHKATAPSVFICRKVCYRCNMLWTQREGIATRTVLDFQQVQSYVTQFIHQYFTQIHPTITCEREDMIRESFHHYDSCHPNDLRHQSMNPTMEGRVPVDIGYTFLLTDEERECILLDEFINLWTKYCKTYGIIHVTSMSIDEALTFIKTLQ